MIDRTGCSRIVFLSRKFAFKIPAILDSSNRLSWKSTCWGMLANMQEVIFSNSKKVEFCPVLFSLPLGLLVVMPRVLVMTGAEFLTFDYEGFVNTEDYYIPVENKANSFGWLDNRVVAIDYGN